MLAVWRAYLIWVLADLVGRYSCEAMVYVVSVVRPCCCADPGASGLSGLELWTRHLWEAYDGSVFEQRYIGSIEPYKSRSRESWQQQEQAESSKGFGRAKAAQAPRNTLRRLSSSKAPYPNTANRAWRACTSADGRLLALLHPMEIHEGKVVVKLNIF